MSRRGLAEGVKGRGKRAAADAWSHRREIAWWLPPLYALLIGWRHLPPASEPLRPDAREFLGLASNWEPSFWLGGFREPLWLTLNAVPIAVFGEDPTVLRMGGVVAFAALVLATQYLTRALLGHWFAVVGGSVLALSDWMIDHGISGLRDEFAALLTVVVAYTLIRRKPGWRTSFLLGALVGLAAMTRWDTLILTVPVVAIALYLNRVRLVQALACAAVAVALVLPFCIGNADKYGDPLYHSNRHAAWHRNIEFADEPGFPTSEDLARDPYLGGDETWPHYLLGRHSPGWLLEYTVRGTGNTALNDWALVTGQTHSGGLPTLTVFLSLPTLIPWLLVLGTVAGALYLLRRGQWVVPVLVALALLQHAPIQHFMDPRYGLGAVPFMLVCVLASVRWTGAWLLAAADRFVRARQEATVAAQKSMTSSGTLRQESRSA